MNRSRQRVYGRLHRVAKRTQPFLSHASRVSRDRSGHGKIMFNAQVHGKVAKADLAQDPLGIEHAAHADPQPLLRVCMVNQAVSSDVESSNLIRRLAKRFHHIDGQLFVRIHGYPFRSRLMIRGLVE